MVVILPKNVASFATLSTFLLQATFFTAVTMSLRDNVGWWWFFVNSTTTFSIRCATKAQQIILASLRPILVFGTVSSGRECTEQSLSTYYLSQSVNGRRDRCYLPLTSFNLYHLTPAI